MLKSFNFSNKFIIKSKNNFNKFIWKKFSNYVKINYCEALDDATKKNVVYFAPESEIKTDSQVDGKTIKLFKELDPHLMNDIKKSKFGIFYPGKPNYWFTERLFLVSCPNIDTTK